MRAGNQRCFMFLFYTGHFRCITMAILAFKLFERLSKTMRPHAQKCRSYFLFSYLKDAPYLVINNTASMYTIVVIIDVVVNIIIIMINIIILLI